MAVGISELVAAIGDENIQLQNLDQAAITLDWHRKKGARITFGTEVALDASGTERLGLILWLDRKVVKRIMSELGDGNA